MVTDEMVDAAIRANTNAKLFGGEPRDWVRAALEAALSAAEPELTYQCDVCTTPGYGDAPCSPVCDRPKPSVAVKDTDAPYNVEAIAKVISISYGENPEDDAPFANICGPNNEPLPNWMAYEEQAKAVFIWMDAVISALTAQAQDVAGWQLVPKYATVEMEAAALERVKGYHDISEKDWRSKMPKDLFRLAWPAMLAAAPAKQEGDHD